MGLFFFALFSKQGVKKYRFRELPLRRCTMADISAMNYYLRRGLARKEISQLLDLPSATIKNWCFRFPDNENTCLHCGADIAHTPGKQKRIFCSDKCRIIWWRKHPELMQLKMVEKECAHCQETFLSYASSQRKFCSRKCYYKSKHKEAPNDGKEES